ncbi:MAG: CopG family transcriptional regulator [Deltaproteobacteria bacterium]|nr:CopG family transcriptional regulator [Deltaproteobacteria bacterium]
MPKVVTLRLSDEEYNLYAKAAESVKRPISNLINYLAQQKLEEDLFVDQIEMDEMLGNKILIKSLKQGSSDAKLKKGTFVDV